MFKKLNQILLKEVDNDGQLKSFKSLCECKNMDVLSIVKITESRYFFRKTEHYNHTEFTLQDILQDMDTMDSGGFRRYSVAAVDLKKKWQAKSGMKLVVPFVEAEQSLEGGGTMVTTEIKLECVTAGLQKVDSMFDKSTINKDHILFKIMKKDKRILGLGVVYEVMKNENPVKLEQENKGAVAAKIASSDPLGCVQMEGHGSFETENRLKLDAGCVLGFKVHPLSLDRIKSPPMTFPGPIPCRILGQVSTIPGQSIKVKDDNDDKPSGQSIKVKDDNDDKPSGVEDHCYPIQGLEDRRYPIQGLEDRRYPIQGVEDHHYPIQG
ncbi:uncharacterized protein LOC133121211 [Conger conger]|uniref:uncharacterized protein LOC133121211 n=1 Tax=Conger conger TaxID=82655 RepID=UPI002A5A1E4D|nr:uncharacterized protein LOC133121211 [Conger conger]